jgi:hypothetical protein
MIAQPTQDYRGAGKHEDDAKRFGGPVRAGKNGCVRQSRTGESDHPQEQAESCHDETQRHHRKTGANPCQEGALRSEKNARIRHSSLFTSALTFRKNLTIIRSRAKLCRDSSAGIFRKTSFQ